MNADDIRAAVEVVLIEVGPGRSMAEYWAYAKTMVNRIMAPRRSGWTFGDDMNSILTERTPNNQHYQFGMTVDRVRSGWGNFSEEDRLNATRGVMAAASRQDVLLHGTAERGGQTFFNPTQGGIGGGCSNPLVFPLRIGSTNLTGRHGYSHSWGTHNNARSQVDPRTMDGISFEDLWLDGGIRHGQVRDHLAERGLYMGQVPEQDVTEYVFAEDEISFH